MRYTLSMRVPDIGPAPIIFTGQTVCPIRIGLLVLFFFFSILSGTDAQAAEREGIFRAPIFPVTEYDESWMVLDRSGDGTIDYAIKLDNNLRKVMEAVDHNNNGFMDDFYFYENGVFARQEIDTNADQAIDLWIFMYRGVYVQRWERDTNHDGTPDLIRDYDN